MARGQPRGLWVLFITEMWERFSYYGMRALLVFYLIARTSADNPGFGWSQEIANAFYGWYTGLVYLTPILGGWLADRFLGTHRSMLLGGWIIAAGHFCLAATELWGHGTDVPIALGSAPGAFLTFMAGLLLIIVGTGFFKPCVSVMVGQLYDADDPRRDSGFTIFYMGINVGGLLSAFVAGTLGEKVGWHWGFGSAGVGMVVGLLTYQLFRPMFLHGIGLPPRRIRQSDPGPKPTSEEFQVARIDEHERTRPLTRVDWERMAVVMILVVLAIVFWAGFEQAGSSMNLFALERTDRSLPGLKHVLPASWHEVIDPFPATWYQSVNPAAVVIFAPLFAWLWIWLDRRGLQPSTPVKYALGLWLLGLGYLAMVPAGVKADRAEPSGPQWLVYMYVLATWGELCLSPVGLSMVTKLAPARCTSVMMGLYFGSNFVGSLAAGYLAASSGRMTQVGFLLLLAIVPIVTGTLLVVLSPVIRRMMHGLH
jgi:POT family proton-dependent oligopeptide transporter